MVVPEVLESLEEWLAAMPPSLRKTPMIGVIGIVGKAITPEVLVNEVRRQTPTGKMLERFVIQRGVEALR